MKVIIVNGYPRSGKNTFVDMCKEWNISNGGNCIIKEKSTVDTIKEIAQRDFGWNGVKDAKGRKLLSDLKDAATAYNDFTFNEIKEYKCKFEAYASKSDKAFLFVYCREPAEIEKFVQMLGALTVFVVREEVSENFQSNWADSAVEDYKYDVYIYNNEGIDGLRLAAGTFMEYLMKETENKKRLRGC